MTRAFPTHLDKTLVITLSAICAITPFAIDSYLPAMPVMAESMNVDISMLSVTVSLYVLGLAVGQLIGGPLSDRKGRRPVMVLGLAIFALASVLLTTSSSIEMLWLWRAVQAVGGGIALVGVPATIRDNANGAEAAKLFSLVALITMIAPSIAPSVGTLILSLADWRAIFYFLALTAVLVIGLAVAFIPSEAASVKKATGGHRGLGFIGVLKERRALGYMIAQAFAYSVMMIFLANASMIYMGFFGVSAEQFSMLFAANIATLIAMNRLNTFLLSKFEPATLLKGFLLMQFFGGLTLLASSLIAPERLLFVVPGFVIAIGANGGIMANASACYLKYFGNNAGTASAVLGAVQCTVGASVSAIAAFISMGMVQPVIIVMLVSSTIALMGAMLGGSGSGLEISEELV
ncbi:Bcr/CflA family efflux MFS transporter [Shewanella canadensis]|uniref:Bcr/CflA family efflux transporter n=1 Tax=Shewanella canadensis TaxID=271096 RepID=A0A431WWY1_9GAMM|nr:multidrug effflux MFS transporter [Shewanella canadensis]RTR39952.1 Bcr/CflA family efflux MFS transporter [Shewanella canadensis]